MIRSSKRPIDGARESDMDSTRLVSATATASVMTAAQDADERAQRLQVR